MKTNTYYCQSCGAQSPRKFSVMEAYGGSEKCACGACSWDDMPKDVVLHGGIAEEGSKEHFDRYVAGDR